MKTLKLLAAVTIMLGFLQVNAGPAISEEKYSGFLEDYPTFTADKDRPGALIYHKAGAELKKYTKIMLDPIEIWYAKDSKYKGISPDDLKTLADSFRQVIIAELEPDYPVVMLPEKSGDYLATHLSDWWSQQECTLQVCVFHCRMLASKVKCLILNPMNGLGP